MGNAVLNKTLLFSSLGLIPAAFSPVLAADGDPNTSLAQANLAQGGPAPMVYNWTGLYVGADFGINAHRTKQTTFSPGLADYSYCWVDGDCSDKFKDTAVGIFAGVHAGFNFQFGNIVVGPEVDFGGSTARNEARQRGSYDWKSNTGLEALGTARLRLGFAFDRALIYVTGGGALGRVVSEYSAGDNPTYSWSKKTDWRVGYVAGGGVEYGLDGPWSIKGEGIYYAFNKKKSHNSTSDVYGPGNFINSGIRDKADGIIARIGISRRF
jgi:outer membrane immunogenic protein